MFTATLAVRSRPGNPDHHLWNNHGTWFVHYTVHRPDRTRARIRRSLGTHCLTEARRHRDQLLASLRPPPAAATPLIAMILRGGRQ